MPDSNKPSDAGQSNDRKPSPDFLTVQQDDAKAAISRVVADMGSALKHGASISDWAKHSPWVTAGAAAAAGFVAGLLIAPKKGQSIKEKFEQMRESVTPTPTPEEIAAAAHAQQAKSDKPGMVAGLLRDALKAVGPAIAAAISTSFSQPQKPAPADTSHEHNGGSTPAGFGVYRDFPANES